MGRAGIRVRARDRTADPLVKRELLASLATLHDQSRDDPRRALEAYERLFALDETDAEPLEQMDSWRRCSPTGTPSSTSSSAKSIWSPDDGERASFLRRIGETKRDMLEDKSGATVAYERALELDPESTFTIDSLIELYERATTIASWSSCTAAASSSPPETSRSQFTLLMQVVRALREEPRRAARGDRVPARGSELRSPLIARCCRALDRLYRAEQMWPELLDNLRAEAASAETQAERVRCTKRSVRSTRRGSKIPAPRSRRTRRCSTRCRATSEAVAAVHHIGETREDL